MNSKQVKKVLLITNIPTPYRIPLFNELHRQCASQNIELKVIFGALGYERRQWNVDLSECNFDYEVLPSRRIKYRDSEKTSFTYPGLWRLVKREEPDVIITNGFSIASTKLLVRSWFKNTPYIIWSGAIPRNGHNESPLRRLQRRLLVKCAKGFIAYGTAAKEYLIQLGAREGAIEIGINTTDCEFFATETKRYRNELKKGHSKHLLYLGNLPPRKNVMKVINVVERLVQSRNKIVLNIVGDGEQKETLQQYVSANGLNDHVVFHGYQQKSEVPSYFANASCFLFQTDFDIWGLVLVEAMASGIPCIASIKAGATRDLIEDGVTGFAVDFSQTIRVAEKIEWILTNTEKAERMGKKASQCIAQKATIEVSASGFLRVIDSVIANARTFKQFYQVYQSNN